MPPPMDTKEEKSLSTDVSYLYRISKAVSEGTCAEDLSSMKPGQIVHSRWLTKASRLLRLYVATRLPSTNLKILANFIMKVYVPMYFSVKYYNSVVHGSVLLYKFIKSTQFLPQNLKQIVNKIIQNNAFFAHPENVLLAMLFDERKSVREKAIKKIQYYREQLYDSTNLRPYKKHPINFNCTDYVDLVDLDNDDILSEPPFTTTIPLEHLLEYINSDVVPLPDPGIPSHIQGTERCVQLLTHVSRRVIAKNRDDVMAVTLESRTRTPRMDSKKDLKTKIC